MRARPRPYPDVPIPEIVANFYSYSMPGAVAAVTKSSHVANWPLARVAFARLMILGNMRVNGVRTYVAWFVADYP